MYVLSFFKCTTLCFFLQQSIPRKFLKHGIQKKTAKLSNYIGKTWPVKIQGNVPDLYFGKGWKQFTEDNDLHIGYFLVFCHEGDINFSVMVLDTTQCQKSYMATQIAIDENIVNSPDYPTKSEPYKRTTTKICEPPKYTVTLQLRNLKGHYYIVSKYFVMN